MSLLTKEQRAIVLKRAIQAVYEDTSQNNDYHWSVINQYVRSHTPLEQARLVCSDEREWPELFDFDPANGEPWPEEHAQEDE